MADLFLKDFTASSWLTTFGVRKKRKELEKRGLPNVKGCLFFTLTIDPALGTQSETYDLGKDKLRRFLDALRVYWGDSCKVSLLDEQGLPRLNKDGSVKTRTHVNRYSFGWAWKLEFQENGYAHWHLLVKTNKRFPLSDLPLIGEMWGLGRTNVKRIRKADFEYLFKYVSKCPAYSTDNYGLALPDWVLDYRRYNKDGKPQMRIRFWQTRDFYEPKEAEKPDIFEGAKYYGDEEEVEDEEEELEGPAYSIVRYTIREFSDLTDRYGLLLVKEGKRILYSAKVLFDGPWLESRQKLINRAATMQKIMKYGQYPVFHDIIENTSKIWLHKTKQALQKAHSVQAMA